MLRILLIAAIAAPLLSGCISIIIATDEPTTRVITTSEDSNR